MRSAAALRSAFTAGAVRFGGLQIVFNNAGGGSPPPRTIPELAEALWNDYPAINLSGIFLGMKCGIPLLEQAGGGSVISTSSVGAIGGIAGTAGYSAAKAGVHALTRAVAAETADKRTRVLTASPPVPLPPLPSCPRLPRVSRRKRHGHPVDDSAPLPRQWRRGRVRRTTGGVKRASASAQSSDTYTVSSATRVR